ncbi:MAG TPA: Calx-beta domain-containing protein [Solirubrobacteraceae bacterium]|nr:Calx-beta domain-containing protein [Solirubrobacteraceae bacterium]
MLSSFRSLVVLALTLTTAVLAFAAPASSQGPEPLDTDTPVGGLQQLRTADTSANCISTEPGDPPECATVIDGGTTDARSIAVTPDGENAYVASAGAENAGTLATFTRNQSTGELSFNACIFDPASAEVCGTQLTQLNGASYVVATNENVYVASSASNAVRAFSRSQSTGALTPIADASGGCIQEIGAGGCVEGDGLTGVEYLVLSPDGNFLYAISSTHPSTPTQPGAIAILELDADTGAISQDEDNFVAVEGVRAADISPDGADLYAVAPGEDKLYRFDRDTTTGLLTQGQCIRDEGILVDNACADTANGLNGVFDVEVVTTGAHSDVYTISRVEGSDPLDMGSTLVHFHRNTGTGALTSAQCLEDNESAENCTTTFNGIYNASSITARPDGQFLYVTGTGDNAIAYFGRATADGTLTQQAGADEKCVSDGDAECGADSDTEGLTGVNETAVSPDGEYLYSTAAGDDAVAQFAIQYAPVCPDITRDDVPAQTTVDITPTCTDINQPRDLLSVEVVTQPNEGNVGDEGAVTAVDTNADGRNDTLRYDPNNFIGTTTFTYRGRDDQGNPSGIQTVTVTVLPTGAPVISVSDAGASEGDGTMQFTFQRSGPTTETITVTYSTQNDTAVAPGDYTAQPGQTVIFNPGEVQKTINVAIADDNVDEETERFRVAITNVIASGGPAPAVSDALGVGTIADNDTAIASIADTTVGEGAGTATLTVTLSNPSSRTVTVQYGASEGTATDPEDFDAPDGGSSVSFAPGDVSETVSIPIVNDTTTEQTEQFTVGLSSPSSGASLGDATGQVTITDNDVPSISISNVNVAEGDSGTRNATFNVTLSSPTSQTVTVAYATANGTATAGTDYTTTNGTLTFSPGELVETINVPVLGNTVEEADETFNVNLSSPTNATIADNQGVGTIENDDITPSLSVSDASIAEGNADLRNATFTVSLSQPPPGAVTVDWATSNGTATAGSDYNAANGTVTFAAGETTKTINVAVRGDTAVEGDETFVVTLTAPTNATIGDATGTGRILNDDQQPVPPTPEPPAPRTTIVVGDTAVSEGDAGTRDATFTVALSQAASAPISVDVTTANGTALGGEDYRAGSGRLTFAPGETSKPVPIPVVGDTRPEADEQFTLRLSDAAGADIVRGIGTATVANDDIQRRLPGLRFSVTPRRDLTLPHVFRVTGQVILPAGVTAAEGCGTGRVSAQYKNGGNTISTRRAVLDAQCRFTIRTPFNIRSRLRNARTLKLTVRFLGNRYLSPRTAQSVFVRVRR